MKISLGKVTEDGFLSAPTSKRRKAILGAGGLLLRLSLFLTQRLASPHFTTEITRDSPRPAAAPRKISGIPRDGVHNKDKGAGTGGAPSDAPTLVQPCQEGAEGDMNASATARSYRFRAEGA